MMKNSKLYILVATSLALACLTNALSIPHFCDPSYQYQCANENCTESQSLCNGFNDCGDFSDETFEKCYSSKCETSQFRCIYGGCIPDVQMCNGAMDCLDGTDENKYLCADGEDMNGLQAELQGNCTTMDSFQCKITDEPGQQCISISQICDGKLNCADGSDETIELCGASICSEDAFRCKYGACVPEMSKCDHKIDCFDGSDETPAICAQESTSSWYIEECHVPDNLPHMRVEDYVSNVILSANSTVLPNVFLKLSCASGYELVGVDNNVCQIDTETGGKWRSLWPKCIPVCEQSMMARHFAYTTRCINGRKLVDCQKPTHLMGTEMQVFCAPGFKAVTKHLELTCEESGEWTSGSLQCDPICGYIPATLKDAKPWTVSIFRTSSKPEFDFSCLGTIIAPHIVLTAVECFQNSSLDHTVYRVVEGHHEIAFKEHEQHGYKVHKISAINRLGEGIQIASMVLAKPFQFSGATNPICIGNFESREKTSQYNGKLGDSLAVQENNVFSIIDIVGGNVKYDIGQFQKEIDAQKIAVNQLYY